MLTVHALGPVRSSGGRGDHYLPEVHLQEGRGPGPGRDGAATDPAPCGQPPTRVADDSVSAPAPRSRAVAQLRFPELVGGNGSEAQRGRLPGAGEDHVLGQDLQDQAAGPQACGSVRTLPLAQPLAGLGGLQASPLEGGREARTQGEQGGADGRSPDHQGDRADRDRCAVASGLPLGSLERDHAGRERRRDVWRDSVSSLGTRAPSHARGAACAPCRSARAQPADPARNRTRH